MQHTVISGALTAKPFPQMCPGTSETPPYDIHQYVRDIFRLAPSGVDCIGVLAGGCLRSFYDGTQVKDYDLFFFSHADWVMAVQFFKADSRFVEVTKEGEDMFPSFQRKGCPPFNLIGFKFHASTGDLANSFDFTCCCMAAQIVDTDWMVELSQHPSAIFDSANKILRVNQLQHYDRLVKRMERYMAYGYKPVQSIQADIARSHTVPPPTHGSGVYN